MLKIMIVDDEKNIRAGIKKILSESVTYDVQYLEAKNGLEALDVFESDNPELVITDIRMPKMDGLELMKKLCEREVRPDLIVLSGFDEFSFAKEAIKCGAVSYILKPVDRNELISVVTGAIAGIERKKKSTVAMTIQRIMSEGRVTRTMIPGGFSFEPPFYFVLITGLANPESLAEIIDDTACYVLEKKTDSVCILIHESEKAQIENFTGEGSVRISISLICRSLANLRTAWRQALVASVSRFFRPEVCVYTYHEPNSPFDRSFYESQFHKMTALVGSGDEPGIVSCIDGLFSFETLSQDDKSRYLFILQNYISSNIIKKFWEYSDTDMYLTLKGIMIENFSHFNSLDEYKKTVLDYILYLNALLKKDHVEHPFIIEALEYLQAHFTEDINMTIVANHVSINYTYFSEKFKEHTGGNFNDYLKNMRIEEAKRLLKKGCYKVYEVSKNSGFGDVKYFMKTFKETTGLTPGYYKKQF